MNRGRTLSQNPMHQDHIHRAMDQDYDIEHSPCPPWAWGVITGLSVGVVLFGGLLVACLLGWLH